MNKNDVVVAFNVECLGLAVLMDRELDENFPKNETRITFPLYDTQMPDVDSAWWDGTNILISREYFDGQDDKDQSIMLRLGICYLRGRASHVEELDKFKNKTGDYRELMGLYPHQVGSDNSNYGRILRDTVGYETLDTVCAELGNVDLSIWMVNNPHTQDLKSAFMFSVAMKSTDAIPLRTKLYKTVQTGLFEQLRTHFKIP